MSHSPAVRPIARRAVTLLGAVALAVAVHGAQDADPQRPELPRPGAQHELLARKAGTWDTTMVLAAMPGEHRARYEARMDHGGLWLVGDYRGEFMGAPFSGHEVMGYSATRGRFSVTWVDSWTDHPMLLEGDWNEETSTLSLFTEGRTLGARHAVRERHDTRFVDDDTFIFTMHHENAEGGFDAVMTVTYRRVRSG